MGLWVVRIPYSGTASIAIESDKKPDSDHYRAFLQAGEIDPGLPQFQSMKATVKKARPAEFSGIKKIQEKKLKSKKGFLEYIEK